MRHWSLPLIVLCLGLSLAACGRKGIPELPPGAPPQDAAHSPVVAPDRTALATVDSNPGLIQPPNKYVDTTPEEKMARAVKNPTTGINGPTAHPSNKPFLLDPLLQ